MEFLTKIRFLLRSVKNANRIYRILNDKEFKNNRLLGEILRNTHSIEKGLSLEKVRLGFGVKKISEAYNYIKIYRQDGGDMSAEPLMMFVDALKAYLDFHTKNDFYNEDIKNVDNIYKDLLNIVSGVDGSYGGVLSVNKSTFNDEELSAIERLFNNRHSIREFDHTSVDEELLHKAIELAMRCPSACNRQCHRLYIVDKNDFSILDNWFDGTGGFANDLDKMIFISGNMSMYRMTENHQWIVTGTIFASYLTLALEAYGIGCCFIQRPVLPNIKWDAIRDRIGASGDEMLICCLGIGNIKQEYKVPVSHRLKYDTIVTKVTL